MAIYALGDIEPQIDPAAYVHPDATIIGDVRLGPDASVWPQAVLRGDDGFIQIGARTSVQDGSVLHTTPFWPTTVGDDCVIGHQVHLEGCTVENGALIGNHAVVLHRVHVGEGAIVAANAVALYDLDVPARATAMGIPAKVREDSADPEMIAMGAQSYVDRVKRYRKELRRID